MREKIHDLDYTLSEKDVHDLNFGDYLSKNKDYKVIDVPFQEVVSKLQNELGLYNANVTVPLSLVFFKDAVVHLTRLIRILRISQSHILFIGTSG